MLPAAVVLTGLVVAGLARRWHASRDRLSPASTTMLALLGAVVLGALAMEQVDGAARPWATVPAAATGAVTLVAAGALVNETALRPLRLRVGGGPSLAERAERWAREHHVGPGRTNLLAVAVGSVRRATRVRITGLAAEMSYYALISLVPLATALGASLGSLERLVGRSAVDRIEATLVDAVTGVFAEQVTSDVLTPLISGLLREERTGVAVGSIAVALWLASRMFRAAIRALDDAYRVPERRTLVGQYVLGIALAMGAVVTLVVILVLVVVGPLLGDGRQIADTLGLGEAFETAWALARWPAVGLVTATYLTILYRYAPNVDTTWTRCLPGAVLGTVGLVLVALGFSTYLDVVGVSTLGTEGAADGTVVAAAQVVGVILAGVVWLWLSSIVTLAGGVLNAELDRERERAAGGAQALPGGGPDPGSRRRR